MTGVDYRSEVIEESYCIEGPWKKYEFLYKPGKVNNSLPFVGEIFSHIHISNVSFYVNTLIRLINKLTF